jgi:hypothetical protein
MVISDEVGGQSGIHHQFANPVAVRLLLAEQKAVGPLNSGIQFSLGGNSLGWLTRGVP